MQRILLVGALTGLACGGGNPKVAKPVPPPLPGNDANVQLPEVPAKIDRTQSAPTEGNSPTLRSPILDILKAENGREIDLLKKAPEPAYYLAYQLVEQRVVSLEAEGGALIQDNDDSARNLDVEVRVGSP